MLLWYPIILSLVIGLAMLGVWAMLLVRGEVAELSDGSRAIRFRLAAEGLTAVLLIGAAVALLAGVSPPSTALVIAPIVASARSSSCFSRWPCWSPAPLPCWSWPEEAVRWRPR